MSIDVRDKDLRWLPVEDSRLSETLRRLRPRLEDGRPHLMDTTMLYAPRSGGVKRYLTAKRAWLARTRPQVRHTLLVPGARHGDAGTAAPDLRARQLPFGDGYRWPSSQDAGCRGWIAAAAPTLIEAGDPYTPGQAALEAGQRLGAPVVGFCHTDLGGPGGAALRRVGRRSRSPSVGRGSIASFDRVVAPSRFIAEPPCRSRRRGCGRPAAGRRRRRLPARRRDRAWLRRRLGLPASARLLVFAGRPARRRTSTCWSRRSSGWAIPMCCCWSAPGQGCRPGAGDLLALRARAQEPGPA